jgi:heterodisulfide reductase subunit B
MAFALFLGCTIPARSRNYELSSRKVAEKLGLELVDVESFICCGFPVRSANLDSSTLLGAYNLALAAAQGLDICTLCSSCTSALTETAHRLDHDEAARNRINQELERVGLRYESGIRVRHFARLLYEEVGKEEIEKHVQKRLDGLRIAAHYGCHYLKPSGIYGGFDDPENPKTLDELVALTGASPVMYKDRKRCCGGPILPVDEKTSLSVAREKLDDIKEAGAHAISLVCPFCAVMYDSNQKGISAEFDTEYDLPVLYLPQILGISMGFDRKELGLNLNVVKTKKLLAPFFDGSTSS